MGNANSIQEPTGWCKMEPGGPPVAACNYIYINIIIYIYRYIYIFIYMIFNRLYMWLVYVYCQSYIYIYSDSPSTPMWTTLRIRTCSDLYVLYHNCRHCSCFATWSCRGSRPMIRPMEHWQRHLNEARGDGTQIYTTITGKSLEDHPQTRFKWVQWSSKKINEFEFNEFEFNEFNAFLFDFKFYTSP